MIWYRFEDGMLWKQHRLTCRSSPSRTRVVTQRSVPFTLDSTRSFDEVVFTSMLRDYFKGDKLAELQASVLGSRIVNLFPNKRRAGNWTISENDLAVAVIGSLVRHKLATMTAPIEVEYVGGQRRDTLREEEEEPMSTYRRKNNGEFNRYLARLEAELREQGEEAARQQEPQVDPAAQEEANVALFLDTCTKAVEQFQNRSRLWWWKTIAIEWLQLRAEAVVRLAGGQSRKGF
jgi:hypothetical protein